jgi:hypothetical protein
MPCVFPIRHPRDLCPDYRGRWHHLPLYRYTGKVVQRHTGRAASLDPSKPTQFSTEDGLWVNTTRTGFHLTPSRLRRLASMLDQYGLPQALLDEKYQNLATIQANLAPIGEVLEHFFAHMPQEDAWRAGQENSLPWGGVRSMDEISNDLHLHDRGFFTAVEHPELGRRFIYPGGATIYNGSPWRISRRAPLIGEHTAEVFCGELSVPKAALTLLAESEIIEYYSCRSYVIRDNRRRQEKDPVRNCSPRPALRCPRSLCQNRCHRRSQRVRLQRNQGRAKGRNSRPLQECAGRS